MLTFEASAGRMLCHVIIEADPDGPGSYLATPFVFTPTARFEIRAFKDTPGQRVVCRGATVEDALQAASRYLEARLGARMGAFEPVHERVELVQGPLIAATEDPTAEPHVSHRRPRTRPA